MSQSASPPDDSGSFARWTAWIFSRRIFIVPVVLSLIAGLHFYRHYTLNQSSWGAGCGFGMFATVDYHGSRFVRCRIITELGTFAADIEGVCEYQNLKSRVVPVRSELKTLAKQLSWWSWELMPAQPDGPGDTAPVLVPRHPNSSFASEEVRELARVLGIELELRAVQLDQTQRVVRTRIMQSFRQPIPPGRRHVVIPVDVARANQRADRIVLSERATHE
ncbi:MAG: hypothetical protein ACR2NP_17715 [Pirellulaceae bacterium]